MTLDEKFLDKIELIERQIKELKTMAQLNLNKEWYTTAEAALLLDIKPKTVANYCISGKFKKVKKENGRWKVHRSSIVNRESKKAT